MQPISNQQYPNNSQFIPANDPKSVISSPACCDPVPLLAHIGRQLQSIQPTYFQQYQNLLAGFKGNIDCRLIPSRKGDTFTLTKAGAEKICRFFGLNYNLVPLSSN